MKHKILFLFLMFLVVMGGSACRMHYARGAGYRPWRQETHTSTARHYGVKKHYVRRKEIWGRHHYGPRPYGHRGWYR